MSVLSSLMIGCLSISRERLNNILLLSYMNGDSKKDGEGCLILAVILLVLFALASSFGGRGVDMSDAPRDLIDRRAANDSGAYSDGY